MKLSRRFRRRSPRIEPLEVRSLLSVQATPLSTFGNLQLDPTAYDPSRILVRYKPEAIDAKVVFAGKPLGLVPGLREVPIEPGQDYAAVLNAYRSDSNVLYAQPDFLLHLLDTVTPNDPGYANGQLWGLNNTGQSSGTPDADIDAPEAWSISTGSGNMIVAVIDTGVQYTHPDLAQNMWVNRGEIPGNRVDDDGNGFVDDIYGYDFINNDGDPMDDNGHGTHVAGTIGALGNNSAGVTGINWDVQIMALKFLGANGNGSSSDAIRALGYAVQMGAKISNNSYGGDGFEQAFQDALDEAAAAGHIFVAAAGNDGRNIDSQPTYPASYNRPNVVTVAATDRRDLRASFSNYGATTVELGAPGSSIYSTYRNNSYTSLSGTSMASPHVAGAIALLWDYHPDWSYNQVIARVLATVDPVASLAGKTVTGGRLNLNRAIDDRNPTADVLDVSPDPRTDPVGAITVRFSEPVRGLDLSDLTLKRNGGSNLLTSQQTLTTSDGGATYVLGNLSGLTGSPGSYTITLVVSGSGITDDAGNALSGSASDTWAVNAPSSGAVNFSTVSVQPYDPSQDVGGTATVLDSGATLKLAGNTWKKISFPYTVTANTVLEFDFKSGVKGEVHGIGFDVDDAISADRSFRLYGTQAWGIGGYANYDASAPNWKSYRIPVGQSFTGSMLYLTFTNDQDVASPTAESFFRNVRVYENTPVPSGAVNFSTVSVQPYDPSQDVGGTATVLDSGATLKLAGNTWKKISFPYTVTANTVLEFDFKSGVKGEVHGIGFDVDDLISADRSFRLYGTQAWGIGGYANYDASAPGWKSYRIPVGQSFTGSMLYLTFTNDQDVASPTAESFFRNVRVYENTTTSLASSPEPWVEQTLADLSVVSPIVPTGSAATSSASRALAPIVSDTPPTAAPAVGFKSATASRATATPPTLPQGVVLSPSRWSRFGPLLDQRRKR